MWRHQAISRKAASAVMVVLTATGVLANDRKPRAPKPPAVALRNLNSPTAVTGAGTTMPSGLKHRDLQIGTGSPATKKKAVKIHYTGWLESGRKFGSSVEAAQPVIFLLGGENVIQGGNQGIEGMKAGGKRQLWVPSYLAYGAGCPELIPANSNLIFEIEVLSGQ